MWINDKLIQEVTEIFFNEMKNEGVQCKQGKKAHENEYGQVYLSAAYVIPFSELKNKISIVEQFKRIALGNFFIGGGINGHILDVRKIDIYKHESKKDCVCLCVRAVKRDDKKLKNTLC